MVDDLREIWCRVVERVRGELGSANLNLLIEDARPVRFQSGTLTISFTDEWARDWIEARHLPDLARIVRDLVPDVKTVELVTASGNGRVSGSAEFEPARYSNSSYSSSGYSSSGYRGYSSLNGAPRDSDRDRMMGAPLNPRYTFDSFVVGPSNRFAQAASLAVAEDPAGAYNPLFLYGGVGLGKTHLMQAIAHYVREHHRKLYVVYVSSETFTNDLINALSRRSMSEFRRKYRSVDLLLIDDIQFVAGKEQTQEEFFHTFNALYEAEKQIVISSDRPPKEIPTLEERLRSRFEWGLTTDIQPPDLETRVAILRKKASEEGLMLPNDVLLYIANEIQSNIRELEGALIRVVAFASLHGCDITLDVTMEALKDLLSARKTKAITIEAIQQVVAQHFGIKAEEMKSKKRTRSVAYPRQIAMYLARELTDASLPKIGEEFGGRDHSTVIHAYEKVKSEAEQDARLAHTLRELSEKLKNG